MPEADSLSLANLLLGRLTTPSLAAVGAEMHIKLQEVLNSMDPIDREVLVLWHFRERMATQVRRPPSRDFAFLRR